MYMRHITKIINDLRTGKTLPTDLDHNFGNELASALLEVERNLASLRKWRSVSEQILATSQILNNQRIEEQIFTKIVHEAKIILQSDVGYISINSPAQNCTNVLATSGVNTDHFRTIQIPLGTGVLGLVADRRRPVWTSDHQSDPSVTHIESVDYAVKTEGIRGILGAPLLINGNPIGALMVADREVRYYTHDEITAISMLASVTSIALENSRLLDNQLKQVHQLAEQQASNQLEIESLTKSRDFDRSAFQLLKTHPSPSELQQLIQDALNVTCVIYSKYHNQYFGPDPIPRISEATDELLSNGIIKPPNIDKDVHPVYFNNSVIGIIHIDKEHDSFIEKIVETASSVLTSICLTQESLDRAANQKIETVLESIIQGNTDSNELRKLRKLTGIDTFSSHPMRFCALKFNGQAPSINELMKLFSCDTAITRHQNHFCILTQYKSENFNPIEKIKLSIGNLGSFYIGLSQAITKPESLSQAHKESLTYLATAESLRLTNFCASPSSLGSTELFIGSNPAAIEALETCIAPIVQYDSKHKTELELTARTFLEAGRSINKCASTLYVHPNTVRQRIEKIGTFLGHDWSIGPKNLDIHLALRMRRLRASNVEFST